MISLVSFDFVADQFENIWLIEGNATATGYSFDHDSRDMFTDSIASCVRAHFPTSRFFLVLPITFTEYLDCPGTEPRLRLRALLEAGELFGPLETIARDVLSMTYAFEHIGMRLSVLGGSELDLLQIDAEDSVIFWLRRSQPSFEKATVINRSDVRTVLNDKSKFYHFARNIDGFHLPRTYLSIEDVNFPFERPPHSHVIVKPRFGYGGIGVKRVLRYTIDKDRASDIFARENIIQEWIEPDWVQKGRHRYYYDLRAICCSGCMPLIYSRICSFPISCGSAQISDWWLPITGMIEVWDGIRCPVYFPRSVHVLRGLVVQACENLLRALEHPPADDL